MIGHEHEWEPLAGACGVYICACKATGYRRFSDGAIVSHRTAVKSDPEVTRRSLLPFGGRVLPKPGAA